MTTTSSPAASALAAAVTATIAAFALPTIAHAETGSHGYLVYAEIEGEQVPLSGALIAGPGVAVSTWRSIGGKDTEIDAWYLVGADCERHEITGVVAADDAGVFVLLGFEGDAEPAPRAAWPEGGTVSYVSLAPLADCGMTAGRATDRPTLATREWRGSGLLHSVFWTSNDFMIGGHAATSDGVAGLVVGRPDNQTSWVLPWSRVDELDIGPPVAAGELHARFDEPALAAKLLQQQAADARIQGQFGEAIRLANASLALDTESWQAHYTLGVARDLSGEPVEAKQALRRSVELEPGFGESSYSLGLVTLKAAQGGSDLEEAIAHFDDAIEAHPWLATAHGMRGVALYQLGRLEEAIVSCRAATQSEPATADHHTNLVGLLTEAGRLAEAADVAVEKAERFARSDQDWFEAFRVVSALNDDLVLGRAFLRAAAQQPDSPTLNYYAGLAHRDLFDAPEKARASFERVLLLNASDELKSQAASRLEALSH